MRNRDWLKKTYQSQFARNNAIYIAGTLAGGFLGYLFHFFVSRQISVAQYGELQSLLSVMVIFGVFNAALSFFVVRHTAVFAAHKDYGASREFSSFVSRKVSKFTLLLLLFFFIVSPILAKLLHFSSLLGFFIISLANFFSTLGVIYLEILRGWQKFFLVSMIGVLGVLIKILSGVSLAVLFHKTSIVSLSFLISAFAGWYAAKYYCGTRILDKSEKKQISGWKEKYFSEASLRRTALNIFVFSLALVLVSNLDIVLVKYFSSAETTGYYGAFNLIGKIVLWLNLAVVGVILPGAIADGHSGRRPDKKNLLKSYGLMTFIALGFILAYYLMPDFIVNFFFGERYICNTHILWLFGAMSFLLSILTLEANLSFAKHDFRVVYFLAATAVLMTGGLAKYHANLEQIVLTLSTSFLVGYLCVTALNLSHEKRKLNATSL